MKMKFVIESFRKETGIDDSIIAVLYAFFLHLLGTNLNYIYLNIDIRVSPTIATCGFVVSLMIVFSRLRIIWPKDTSQYLIMMILLYEIMVFIFVIEVLTKMFSLLTKPYIDGCYDTLAMHEKFKEHAFILNFLWVICKWSVESMFTSLSLYFVSEKTGLTAYLQKNFINYVQGNAMLSTGFTRSLWQIVLTLANANLDRVKPTKNLFDPETRHKIRVAHRQYLRERAQAATNTVARN